MEALDYFKHPIKVGDRVIFPAGADQMEGTVTKLGNPIKRFRSDKLEIVKISVKNDSGYTKTKSCKVCVNVTLIKDALPEYQL